jgi:hypothetical protein
MPANPRKPSPDTMKLLYRFGRGDLLAESARLELLDPQVARELCLRNRLRVVLPVVDELDRYHF